MWFIFPQILGLGTSPTSQRYAIRNISEAQAYSDHPVLGSRLVEIAGTLLQLHTTDAHKIFGSPDDKKLHSCMTLFSSVKNSNPVFDQVLQKFFNGSKDEKTLKILSGDE